MTIGGIRVKSGWPGTARQKAWTQWQDFVNHASMTGCQDAKPIAKGPCATLMAPSRRLNVSKWSSDGECDGNRRQRSSESGLIALSPYWLATYFLPGTSPRPRKQFPRTAGYEVAGAKEISENNSRIFREPGLSWWEEKQSTTAPPAPPSLAPARSPPETNASFTRIRKRGHHVTGHGYFRVLGTLATEIARLPGHLDRGLQLAVWRKCLEVCGGGLPVGQ